MTDQTTEPESKPEATPESKPAESGERKVPESALTKQAEDFRAENAKLAKQLATRDASDLKAQEADMLAKNEHTKVIEARDKTIREMTEKSTAASRALLEGAAREKLRDLGMERPLSLAGAVAGLPAEATTESLDAWVAQMKVGNEAEFTKAATPVGQASLPGGPATDAGGGDIAARLKSDDPKVRAEAASEQLKADLSLVTG